MTAAQKVRLRSTDKIRVLVADSDGIANRQLLAWLTQHGFDCRIATTGSDVKRLLASWRPRVLVIDLLLPDGNAFAILRHIENEPKLKGHHVATIIM